LEGIVFIGFVEFLGLVGLVKQGSVENYIPFTNDNSINSKNTRNTINKPVGLEGDKKEGSEGDTRVQGAKGC
jgi:hypothetical protein